MPKFIASLDCPHCNTKKSSMSTWDIIQDPNGVIRAPLNCSHCHEIVVALLTTNSILHRLLDQLGNNTVNTQDYNAPVRFQRVLYPRSGVSAIPESVPDKIRESFGEAIDNLNRQKFETAVLLCGKALDIATRGMDSTWSLEKRLKALAKDGKITQDMADWAGEIRLDRNTAIHEDHDFDEKTAANIISLTEAFLTYVYTLPAMVAEHRISRDGQPKTMP